MKTIKTGLIVMALCIVVSCSNTKEEKASVVIESEVSYAVEVLNTALVDPRTKLFKSLISKKLPQN